MVIMFEDWYVFNLWFVNYVIINIVYWSVCVKVIWLLVMISWGLLFMYIVRRVDWGFNDKNIMVWFVIVIMIDFFFYNSLLFEGVFWVFWECYGIIGGNNFVILCMGRVLLVLCGE